jgi:hypothetical protein
MNNYKGAVIILRIELITEKIEDLRLQLENEIRSYESGIIINEKIYYLSTKLDFLILEYMKTQQKT